MKTLLGLLLLVPVVWFVGFLAVASGEPLAFFGTIAAIITSCIGISLLTS